MIPRKLLLWLALGLIGWTLAATVSAQVYPAFAERITQLMLIGVLVIVIIAVSDFLAVFLPWKNTAPLTVERRVSGSVAVGVWSPVTLKMSWPHQQLRPLTFTIHDQQPQLCEAIGQPFTATVAAGGYALTSYKFKPNIRGDLMFGRPHLRVVSPLRLWERQVHIGSAQLVRSLPNFAAVSRYALLATENRLSDIGVLRRRRRGEGLTFEQLREYRQGDSMRQIDWKASTRNNRLISREYEDERDQRVVFLIDCGRRMAAQASSDTLSHFDHALNAVLLLSYVVVRQGDSVGLMTFGNAQSRYLVPGKSRNMVNRCLDTLYDLQPSLQTPDYVLAAKELAAKLTRRSLVVVITNVRDEDDESLSQALKLLSRRNLVLLASLREDVLDNEMVKPIVTLNEAANYAGASAYFEAREHLLRTLQMQGTNILDVTPKQLSVQLVNRYLELKHSGRV